MAGGLNGVFWRDLSLTGNLGAAKLSHDAVFRFRRHPTSLGHPFIAHSTAAYSEAYH